MQESPLTKAVSSAQICRHAIASKQLHENPEVCRAYVDQALGAGGQDQVLFQTTVQADSGIQDRHLKYHMMAHALCAGERDLPLHEKFQAVTEGICYGHSSGDPKVYAEGVEAQKLFFAKAAELAPSGMEKTVLNTTLQLMANCSNSALTGLAMRCALDGLRSQRPLSEFGFGLLNAPVEGPEATAFVVDGGKEVLRQFAQGSDEKTSVQAQIALGVADRLAPGNARRFLFEELERLNTQD